MRSQKINKDLIKTRTIKPWTLIFKRWRFPVVIVTVVYCQIWELKDKIKTNVQEGKGAMWGKPAKINPIIYQNKYSYLWRYSAEPLLLPPPLPELWLRPARFPFPDLSLTPSLDPVLLRPPDELAAELRSRNCFFAATLPISIDLSPSMVRLRMSAMSVLPLLISGPPPAGFFFLSI